jgi:hypothetical protein
VAISLIWPGRSTTSTAWSNADALKYQAASAKLHRLSHEFAHAVGTDNGPRVQAELDKAQSEYSLLRSELDSAMARPKFMAMILRVGGLVLTAAGVSGLIYGRHGSSDR